MTGELAEELELDADEEDTDDDIADGDVPADLAEEVAELPVATPSLTC